MDEREKYHAHVLHESDTWENRHALRWSSVAKQPGVRLEWGSPRGPGTKMASLLAFGTIMSKVVLNRKLASSQLECLPHDGDQRLFDVKAVRPFTSMLSRQKPFYILFLYVC